MQFARDYITIALQSLAGNGERGGCGDLDVGRPFACCRYDSIHLGCFDSALRPGPALALPLPVRNIYLHLQQQRAPALAVGFQR